MTRANTQALADALLAEANSIDPGIARVDTHSANERMAMRLKNARDHYIAYGIRHALLELRLYPETRTSCAYPDGDGCDPTLCPPECFEEERNV